MTTSLMRGSPRRETWTQGPVSTVRPCFSRTSPFRRRAADQTPITERGSAGAVGLDPPPGRVGFGTLIAIVWAFEAFLAFTPGGAGGRVRWWVWERSNAPRAEVR